MQAAWEEVRAGGAGAAPLDAERMAELLCGSASPGAVLAALRALAADLSHFKQVCTRARRRALPSRKFHAGRVTYSAEVKKKSEYECIFFFSHSALDGRRRSRGTRRLSCRAAPRRSRRRPRPRWLLRPRPRSARRSARPRGRRARRPPAQSRRRPSGWRALTQHACARSRTWRSSEKEAAARMRWPWTRFRWAGAPRRRPAQAAKQALASAERACQQGPDPPAGAPAGWVWSQGVPHCDLARLDASRERSAGVAAHARAPRPTRAAAALDPSLCLAPGQAPLCRMPSQGARAASAGAARPARPRDGGSARSAHGQNPLPETWPGGPAASGEPTAVSRVGWRF